MAGGVIDSAKAVRSALQKAAFIASLLLTTEALVCEILGEKKEVAMSGGGGMDGMNQRTPSRRIQSTSPCHNSTSSAVSRRCVAVDLSERTITTWRGGGQYAYSTAINSSFASFSANPTSGTTRRCPVRCWSDCAAKALPVQP